MKRKILIVDDDAQNRDILKEAFEDAYELAEAIDGNEALEQYISFSPDIILLDIMMPNMNGKEVLRIIRQSEEKAGLYIGKGAVPIIMLTAAQEAWFESFKNGCDLYIVKPFEAIKLRTKVEEVLSLNKATPHA